MADAERFTPTIAQALYGADWGTFNLPPFAESMFDGIMNEWNRVFWNTHQKSFQDHRHEATTLGTVYYHPYVWDACDCGGQYPRHSGECRLTLDHSDWNRRRLDAISDPDPAGFGRLIDFSAEREAAFQAIDPRPTCSCGAADGWDEHACTPSCISQLPNFGILADAVQIRWYKYPGRGMSVNVQLTTDEWVAWHDRVMAALDRVDHDHRVKDGGHCGRFPCELCGRR
jgi:hypothetical protein